MHFGHRIQQLREERRYSIQDLAAATEIPVESLAQVEAGSRQLSHQEVISLCHALGVGVDDLFTDPPPPEEIGGNSLLIPAAELSKLLDQMKE